MSSRLETYLKQCPGLKRDPSDSALVPSRQVLLKSTTEASEPYPSPESLNRGESAPRPDGNTTAHHGTGRGGFWDPPQWLHTFVWTNHSSFLLFAFVSELSTRQHFQGNNKPKTSLKFSSRKHFGKITSLEFPPSFFREILFMQKESNACSYNRQQDMRQKVEWKHNPCC